MSMSNEQVETAQGSASLSTPDQPSRGEGSTPEVIEKSTSISNLLLLVFVCILQIFCLIVLPFLAYPKALDSAFVKTAPTQYGAVLLPLFLAGLVATALSYLTTAAVELIYKNISPLSVFLLGLTLAPIGVVGYTVWSGKFPEQRIDFLAIWSFAFALVAAIVSFIEWRRLRSNGWRTIFFYTDLPFVLVCLFVIVFKYLVYDWNTDVFNTQTATTFPKPPFSTPKWQHDASIIRHMIRDSLWIGFTAGVIAVQLIVTQVIALVLNFKRLKDRFLEWRMSGDIS